jgi:hypothetical protein
LCRVWPSFDIGARLKNIPAATQYSAILSRRTSNPLHDLLTGANPIAALLNPPPPDCSIKRLNLWDEAFNSLDEAEKKRLEILVVPKGKKAEAEDKKEEQLIEKQSRKKTGVHLIEDLLQVVEKIKDDDKENKWKSVSSYFNTNQA